MKTSMNLSCALRRFGLEKAIELHAKAGFDAFDFSLHPFVDMDWENNRAKFLPGEQPILGDDFVAYIKTLKALAESYGITCNQSHAPFPVRVPEIRSYLKWAIEATGAMGGEYVIIHPDNDADAETNGEMYRELLPFAKEKGVKMATENMWNWDHTPGVDHATPAACSNHEDFLKHCQVVGDDYLVACLDIGHAEMKGLDTDSVRMIKTLGPHLKCLHVHDNDKWHDSHAEPFTMDVEFEPIIKALKETGYRGDMTLEVDSEFGKEVTEEEALEKLTRLANVAKKLVKMFEEA